MFCFNSHYYDVSSAKWLCSTMQYFSGVKPLRILKRGRHPMNDIIIIPSMVTTAQQIRSLTISKLTLRAFTIGILVNKGVIHSWMKRKPSVHDDNCLRIPMFKIDFFQMWCCRHTTFGFTLLKGSSLTECYEFHPYTVTTAEQCLR